MSVGPRTQGGRGTSTLLVVLGVVVAVAVVGICAIQKFGRRSAPPPSAATTAAHPIGYVDAPASESIRGPQVV